MSAAAPSKESPSLELRAQAATWLAALRGPNRTPAIEQQFKQWLAQSEENRTVWERMNEGWELAGGLKVDVNRISASAGQRRATRFVGVTAIAASVIVAVLGWWVFSTLRQDVISTEIGAQRVVSLPDGTRVTLNTDTRLVVRYAKDIRRISLQRGEALFDVARRSDRPFVVDSAGREIRVLGTSFLVRQDESGGLSVTLVEGRIAVSGSPDGADPSAAEILQPGQRLTVSKHSAELDTPEIKRLMAWQRGEVAFDEMPLEQAIAEMNRYSRTSIRVEGAFPAQRRISGLFRAGDSQDFARGIAETYGLDLNEENGQLVLSSRGAPKNN